MDSNFREIESPLSVFNNFQLSISNTLNDVIYGADSHSQYGNQLNLKSQIIFNDKSIILMGFCKLYAVGNDMHIKAICSLNREQLSIMSAISSHHGEVETCFFQYIQMYNKIALNYDEVPNQLLKNIVNMLEQKVCHQRLVEMTFLLPFKSKIGAKVDLNDKRAIFLHKLYSRFEYTIRFAIVGKFEFEYKIYKVLSSDLNENKSIENLRYLENDLLYTGSARFEDAEKFVINLFCYGTF